MYSICTVLALKCFYLYLVILGLLIKKQKDSTTRVFYLSFFLVSSFKNFELYSTPKYLINKEMLNLFKEKY